MRIRYFMAAILAVLITVPPGIAGQEKSQAEVKNTNLSARMSGTFKQYGDALGARIKRPGKELTIYEGILLIWNDLSS